MTWVDIGRADLEDGDLRAASAEDLQLAGRIEADIPILA